VRVFGAGSRVRRASLAEPAVIAALGELDLHTVRALTPQLNETVGTDYLQVILDLSALTLLDSTALGALVQAEHRFRSQGADAVGGGAERECRKGAPRID
jgi:anti-anti-sigma factor